MIPTAIRTSVRDYIRAHHIFEPGPIVVAVSGGADSTALLILLADLADELGIVPHVAHFDHRIRGRQSAQDADFVARLANRVGAPVRVGRAERAARSEDDARAARYAFLRRVASEIGANAIATGHTRDDQAETVLLHLARGSGVAGLAGMRPLREGLARPLLGLSRADTVAVCRAVRIRPRTDPTNRSVAYARNRIRLRVIPELAKINRRVVEAIARLAEAAAELDERRGEIVERVLGQTPSPAEILLAGLADPALRADVLATAWVRATGQTLSKRHRDALVKLTAERDGSRAIDLPGGRAVREYGTLRFAPPKEREIPSDPPRRLARDRTITWNGWHFSLGRAARGDGVRARVPPTLLRALIVRARRPGDRLLAAQHRKVQDVFTDAKVPAAQRAKWPVLASEEGIWWVPAVTEPPPIARGTPLAVAAPMQTGNDLWSSRVRQVASKRAPAARRSQRGPRR